MKQKVKVFSLANRASRNISIIILLLFIFSCGLVGGVYYHNEITVIWHGLINSFIIPNRAPATTPGNTEQSLVKNEPTSHLTMDQLDEPLPLIYSDTLEEDRLQEHLKDGAVVLPLGTAFGDHGNVVVTAHSSGFSSQGPYRFAFAKLGELEPNHEFQITTPTAAYTYRVYKTEVVMPHEVDKLPQDDRSTVTLVTCWPILTNFKRLLVHSELVSVNYHI